MFYTTDPETRIGHVHLKVADLDRAIAFYRDVMGFEVTQRYGAQAAFLSAGGYHHHVGLNTWQSRGGRPPAPGTTGLFHVAFLYPDRPALARTLASVIASGTASTARPTMACPRRSISPTLMAMASRSTATGRKPNGPATRPDSSK
jgi:catechol-2,3-dioxygenase